MARAGCREVSLGFESGYQPLLNAMHKRFHTGDVRNASRLLADHGIRRMGFLLLGGPGETRQSVEESLAFADALGSGGRQTHGGGAHLPPHGIGPDRSAGRRHRKQIPICSTPVFTLRRDLEAWLRKTVRIWLAERPHWLL